MFHPPRQANAVPDLPFLAGDRGAEEHVESHWPRLSGHREGAADPDRTAMEIAEEQRQAYPEMYK